MTVRQRLYRRRFPRALGPLIPSWRSLVSAAEVAHLLELPSARMKGVPVRRVSLPRIPAPPEVGRGRRRATPRPTQHARPRRRPTAARHRHSSAAPRARPAGSPSGCPSGAGDDDDPRTSRIACIRRCGPTTPRW